MQMQAINSLTPVVPAAKETLAGDGENFIDSLRSVHSKSDFIHNRKPEPKTRQDNEPPPATQSEPADIPEQAQIPAAEPPGQVTVAKRRQDNSSPPWTGFITTLLENDPDPSAFTRAEGLPELASIPRQQLPGIIKLKVQNELPPASSQSIEWPDRTTTLVVDHLSGRDQKVSPFACRFVELMQKTATGEPGQAVNQVDPAADLTYTRCAEILGHATGGTAETATVPELAPIRQRYSLTAGRFATPTATGHNAQEAGAGLTVLKISEQVLAENKQDSPGKDILPGQLAITDSSAPHPSWAERTADFINSFLPAQNTPPNPVSGQDGSAARFNQGIAFPEHRIVDKVIQQISLRAGPEQSSSISIRLHPEELGHLKMDLLASNENIKAHIHVQTQLTQEILTKHLHRLREGFAQQGLILDEIQVSVGSDTSSGPGLFNDQRTLHARPHHANAMRPGEALETIMAETLAAGFGTDGSINLRI